MLFSVLIAHFNNARFLEKALDSIYAQSYTNWEVILVDDGSTDDFESVIAGFVNDSRIVVYRNEKNMGCAYTKRACAEKASGQILGFLDPDDTLSPEAIELMVQAHIEKPNCSLIHSTHYICDENLTVQSVANYQRSLPANSSYLLLNDGSIHHFATFKKACYNRTDGINPVRKYNKAIDQDLYYLLEETGDIFFVDRPLYYYRIHAGGISTLSNKPVALMAHYVIIEEACLRRIKKLRMAGLPDNIWVKKYKIRYHKIRILHKFRERKWMSFISSLVTYPFIGGMENILSYLKKLPKEGVLLIRKSFVEN